MELVARLRAAGHFTIVAMTRPFEFEGMRRLQAADALVGRLEDAAHLVAVIEQV